MSETTIGWCDHSVNPIRARHLPSEKVGHYCEKIAAGCTNCYSSAMQRRFGTPAFGSGQRRGEFELFLDESKLQEVLRRKKPTRYFWEDMSDLFGWWVTDNQLDRCFAVMALTPQHTHQLLTKRPARAGEYLSGLSRGYDRLESAARSMGYSLRFQNLPLVPWPIPGVWLGCSISDQATADQNIPELLKCRDLCPVLFVSAEPLLGPVDFAFCDPSEAVSSIEDDPCYGVFPDGRTNHSPVGEIICPSRRHWRCLVDFRVSACGVDWLIIGGESGPHYRPCQVEWIADLARQCQAAGVPVYVKQDAGRFPGQQGRIPDELWALKQFPGLAAHQETV